MQKKVTFKNSKGQRLVGILHIPKGNGPFPAIIVQHGFKGSHNSPVIKFVASRLEKNGFMALRFTFSGHPPSGGIYKDVTISQYLKDIKQAIKLLLKHPQVNKHRLGMVGQSLGALITLFSASYQQKYIRAIVSLASPYDFKAVMSTYQRDKKIDEVGKDFWVISGFKTSKKLFNDKLCNNKVKLIKNIHCPALIIHGNKDERVQVKDAYTIYDFLDKPKEIKIIKGANHNFHNQKYAQQVVNLTTRWFKKYLAYKESKVINVFLEHNGKILILKRSQKVGTHRGLWCAVGGYLEQGKSVLQNAKQEVREELGLKIKRLKDYKIGKSFKFEEMAIDRLWHIHPVLFRLKFKPRIKLDWENTEYRWVKPEEIKKFKTIPMMPRDLKVFNLIK